MSSDVARCEPPEEARGERWHWLYHASFGYTPARWMRGANHWQVPDKFRNIYPDTAWNSGYRWLAVAKPPDRP